MRGELMRIFLAFFVLFLATFAQSLYAQDEYSFDESAASAPAAESANETKKPVEASPEAAAPKADAKENTRKLPKLKKNKKPDQLAGSGLAAGGAIVGAIGGCCLVIPFTFVPVIGGVLGGIASAGVCGLGAGGGGAVAYLLADVPFNMTRLAVVGGATFAVALVMNAIDLTLGLLGGGVAAVDPTQIATTGVGLARLGVSLASIFIIPGTAAAAWFLTDGMDDEKTETPAKTTIKQTVFPKSQQVSMAF